MTIFTGGVREGPQAFLEQVPVSTGDALDAYVKDAVRFSPSPAVARGVEQFFSGRDEQPTDDTRVLTDDEQHERIGDLPLKVSDGMRSGTLNLLIKRKQDELADKSAIARAGGGQAALGLGASLITSMFDPINVASAFIPVLGVGRYTTALAAQVSRAGRAATRVKFGAVEGTVGAAVVEPLVTIQAANEQADYGMADALLNVAFGTVMGGGLHAGFGAVGDALRKGAAFTTPLGREAEDIMALSPDQREALFKSNYALAVEDRSPIVTASAFREQLLGGTAVARVQAASEPVSFTVRSIIADGVPVDADVRLEARKANPELFDEIDAAKKEQEVLRGQLKELAGDRPGFSEVALLDSEIANLRERQTISTKRISKKLQNKVDDLVGERAELDAETRATDTPEMTVLRTKILKLDEKLRDRAVAVSSILRDVRGRMGRRPLPADKLDFQQNEQNLSHQVKLARSPQNLRLLDFKGLEERTADLGTYEDVPDQAGAQAETAELLEEIAAFTNDIEDSPLAEQVKEILAVETENIKLAEAHSDALSAAFRCRTR